MLGAGHDPAREPSGNETVRCRGVRCRVLTKPGVGALHLHTRRWRPKVLREVWFHPLGRRTLFRVAEAEWEAALQAARLDEVMMLAHRCGETRAL